MTILQETNIYPGTDFFTLDGEGLLEYAREHKKNYAEAEPFPHIVIDHLFPDRILEKIILEIKETQMNIHRDFYGARGKDASTDPNYWKPYSRQFLSELNSALFLNFLKELTSIDGLIPDPYYDGGGIHEIKRGGFLKIHTDFNYHRELNLDRRLNLLLYLNKDWKKEYGGDLELWSPDMKSCVKKVEPVFNRTVIFSTTDFSYHGHPDPLECPDSMTRKSLALYYYSNGRPKGEVRYKKSIDTHYEPRPNEKFNRPRKFKNHKAVVFLRNLFTR